MSEEPEESTREPEEGMEAPTTSEAPAAQPMQQEGVADAAAVPLNVEPTANAATEPAMEEPAAVQVPASSGAAPSAPAQAADGGAEADAAVLAASRRHTRRAFAAGGIAAAAAYGFYHWLPGAAADDMQPVLLRRALQFDASVSRAIGANQPLAPTYPLHRAETLRVNGVYGLKRELVPESWRLQVVGVDGARQRAGYVRDVTAWQYRYTGEHSTEDRGHDTKVDPAMATARKMAPAGMVDRAEEDENHTGRKPRGMEEAGESDSTLPPGTPGLLLTLSDLLTLPRRELVTQFKCIEGWSQVVHWAGVRLADFLEAYPPERIDGREPKYVYMETPDGDYYTGYDIAVCRHPQALLTTEMMGAPLTQFHGAPLRLHMPTKYGYKQIKRIGLIAYSNEKPDDYWTKLGYDWYAGL